MTTFYSYLKNSYLQTNLKDIRPGLINRLVQQAWGYLNCDVYDLLPPFNRLTSAQPLIPVQHVDVTRRPQAFGRWALPKLRRELHDKHLDVVLKAITSISDLVHNPERAYEAINLKIVDRLVDLIVHENSAVRERVAMTLTTLAGQAAGREEICKNMALLKNILHGVEDSMLQVRIHIAACIEMIARYWNSADKLVYAGYIPVILANVLSEPDEIAEIHLESLKCLMYNGVGKMQVINDDGFTIFMSLLDSENGTILAKACDCLTQVTTTNTGQLIAYDYDLLPTLIRLLYDERPEVHTSAASTLMFFTVKTKSKLVAADIDALPKRLLQLAKNKLTPSAQQFAIQTLMNLCDHPGIRYDLKNKYYDEIEDIQLEGDPNLKHFKTRLLENINWVPYSKAILGDLYIRTE